MSMSIVERLRDQGLVIQHLERKQIADLLEQQAERIKELEAERDNLKAYSMHERSLGAERGMMEAHQARQELADLRQRIDDAPVVAWMSPGKERLEFLLPSTVYGSHTIPLISKEDLK